MILIFLFYFFLQVPENPVISINTEYGEIIVELYADKAPVTVSNFLKLVNQGRYNGSVFYRVVKPDNQQQDVKIQVIQGGLELKEYIDTIPGIIHEHTGISGLTHTEGTISMARLAPGTASSEFFICVAGNPELDFGGHRNPDGQGFAAFGKVIKGMEIVLLIHNMDDIEQMLIKPVRIENIKLISN